MILSLLILTLVSCSSDVEPTVEISPTVTDIVAVDSPVVPSPTSPPPPPPSPSTPTTSPSDLRTATPSAPPTALPEPTVVNIELPEMPVNSLQTSQCRLTGQFGSSNLVQGTAPAPTPTPQPSLDSRPLDEVLAELLGYRSDLEPLLDSIVSVDSAFRINWQHADTAEEQATQLHVLSTRLAQYCAALSQPNIPIEALPNATILADALRARNAWVNLAIEELKCCDDLHSDFYEIGRNSTGSNLEQAISEMNELLVEYLGGSSSSDLRTTIADRLGLQIALSSSDVLVRNSVDVLITVDEHSLILDPLSLGPDNWSDGSAVRIRRFRNRDGLTLDEAIDQYAPFLSTFGENTRATTDPNPRLSGAYFVYSPVDGWNGSVLMFVNDGFIFLVESWCGDPMSCESVQSAIGSIELIQ